MLSLSHVSLAVAEEYYQVLAENELSESLSPQARYYAQDQTGLWIGKAAKLWGLEGSSVTGEVFANLLAGKSPDGEQQVIQTGQNQKHRAAYDLTFSAPKSVSLLAEVLDPSLRHRIYEAHTKSILEAMRYFEDNFVEARITQDHVTEHVRTGNLMAAMFLENSTRNTFDPQVHSHLVVPNATLRADGKWRALSNESFYDQRLLTGQIYQNALAKEVQALGFDVVHKGKGLFEIAHIPQALLDHFSSRSTDIEQKLPELRRRYPTFNEQRLRDLAAKWSREKKVKLSQEDLRQLWESKFQELGYNKQELLARARSQQHAQRPDLNHAELALSVLSESDSVIKRGDILRLALQYSIGEKTIDDIELELQKAPSAVELAPELYSTREVMETEWNLAEQIAASKGQLVPILARRRSMLIPRDLPLTRDQSATLLQLISTSDGTSLLEGDAGSGKSTLLKTVVANYSRAGYDIKALSPSALAAAGLQKKGIHKATTVASYLTRTPTTTPRPQLVIVDEASLIATKDLQAIYDHVKRGDRILLVGDTKQHQALSRGGIFAKLQKLDLVQSSRLKENIRQQEAMPVIAESVRLLAEQQSRQAFELLDKHHRLKEIADDDERLMAMVEKYLQRSQTQDTLMITQSNREKEKLNQMVRERLIEEGRVEAQGIEVTTNQMKNLRGEERNFSFGYVVGDHFFISEPIAGFRRGSQGEVLEVDHVENRIKVKMNGFGKTKNITIDLNSHGHFLSTYRTREREFAVGDTISFLKTDRTLGIENGRRGEVVGVANDGTITVKTDDQRTISFDTHRYGYTDHAWALTSFKSQGTDTSTVLFSADTRQGLNYNSAYVACSRAKEDIFIYTNSKEEFFNRSQEREMKTTTLDYTWPAHKQAHGLGLQLSHSLE